MLRLSEGPLGPRLRGSAKFSPNRLTEIEKMFGEQPEGPHAALTLDGCGSCEDGDGAVLQADGEVPARRGEGHGGRSYRKLKGRPFLGAGGWIPQANGPAQRRGGNPTPGWMICDSHDVPGLAGARGLCFPGGDVPEEKRRVRGGATRCQCFAVRAERQTHYGRFTAEGGYALTAGEIDELYGLVGGASG